MELFMNNDLISDMITRIRNGNLAKHGRVYLPFSNLNQAILQVLKKEGYLDNWGKYEEIGFPPKLWASLKYKGRWIRKPLFSVIRRVSKPGQRVFSPYKQFSNHLEALKYKEGLAIISTSLGIMSHSKAIQLKKGGEILCFIG
jgi:small subunit ribosomal protein S8